MKRILTVAVLATLATNAFAVPDPFITGVLDMCGESICMKNLKFTYVTEVGGGEFTKGTSLKSEAIGFTRFKADFKNPDTKAVKWKATKLEVRAYDINDFQICKCDLKRNKCDGDIGFDINNKNILTLILPDDE